MKIEPWKASKWSKYKHKPKSRQGKLLCPFCLKEHRTIDGASVCAREVSKYGSVEMKMQWKDFETEWWSRFNKRNVPDAHNIP